MEGINYMLLKDIIAKEMDKQNGKGLEIDFTSVENVRLILHLMENNNDKNELKTIYNVISAILSECKIASEDAATMQPKETPSVQEVEKGVYILYIDEQYRLVAREENSSVYLQDMYKKENCSITFDANRLWHTNLRHFVAFKTVQKLVISFS